MRSSSILAAAAITASLLACTSDAPRAPRESASTQAPGVARTPQSVASTPAEQVDPAREADLRDPFAPPPIAPQPPPPDPRVHKSRRFPVDELRLVGIVASADGGRAMFVDPRGKGWIVARGEFVGRPEVVHVASTDYVASWRVDRIRASDVVLVREDRANSGRSQETRVIGLHPEPAPARDDDEG